MCNVPVLLEGISLDDYVYLWMNSLGGHCLCMCVCALGGYNTVYTPSVSTGQVSFLGGP